MPRIDDAALPGSAERFGDGVKFWRMRGGDPRVADCEGDFGAFDREGGKDDSSLMSADERDEEWPLFRCDFILAFS